MKSEQQDRKREKPRWRVAIATSLGIVLTAVAAYRIVPALRAAPAAASGTLSADAAPSPDGAETDVEALLTSLHHPIPTWRHDPPSLQTIARDPFDPAGSFYTAIKQAQAKLAAAREPSEGQLHTESTLVLKGILRDSKGPAAFVNGTVLLVGDKIVGYTVRAIGQWHVTLERDGREVTLALPIKRLVEGE